MHLKQYFCHNSYDVHNTPERKKDSLILGFSYGLGGILFVQICSIKLRFCIILKSVSSRRIIKIDQ